jgi:myo-inositol-1(or 4)-monophosphatase
MRSANLNIMIKSLEKSTSHVSRDFIELENLQSNPNSASKFTESCYHKIKQMLVNDLSKIRPHYDLIFSDGETILRKENNEYAFLISALDGIDNLLHSGPDFTSSIVLEHSGKDGRKEVIAVVILKIVGGETYYCEKGFGAFLNHRRIRVSKRSGNNVLVAAEDQNFVEAGHKFSLRNYGCRSMEIAYVASSRIEKAYFSKVENRFLSSLFLLIKEAGGKITETEKSIIVSN